MHKHLPLLPPLLLVLSLLVPAHGIPFPPDPQHTYECYYPTVRGVPGYADQEMATEFGHFDFGAFPAVEESDTWIRTVHNWGVPQRGFDTLYISKANLSQDHRDTWWFKEHGNYDLDPDNPLCPNPDPRSHE
ncbi:MAG: hypothetical protein ABID45_00015 [Patescibacteria group bacterium]